MDKLELIFEHTKFLKDRWIEIAMKRVAAQPSADRIPLVEQEKILNEAIVGFLHSFFVMLDNGSHVADHFILNLIDLETGESICGNKAYHEEFIAYIGDHEEDR